MKLSIISATFFTLFLLSATITHLSSATADFILDTNDEPLQNGGAYYVVSSPAGGGGVTLAATGNENCPVSVVQSPLEYPLGSAVIIASPLRILSIYEGLNVGMYFRFIPECADPNSKWTVVRSADGDDHGKLSIKLIGSSEYDDSKVVSGWFNIARSGRRGNKIEFCANGSDRCEDVAVRVDENGVRSLVIADGFVIFSPPT